MEHRGNLMAFLASSGWRMSEQVLNHMAYAGGIIKEQE
jgi:hypothetical protein